MILIQKKINELQKLKEKFTTDGNKKIGPPLNVINDLKRLDEKICELTLFKKDIEEQFNKKYNTTQQQWDQFWQTGKWIEIQ